MPSEPVLAGAIAPDWDAPPGVGALMSTRRGGTSAAPWDTLNLGDAVGDDPDAVAANRARFARACGTAVPVWLRQVHGTRVLRLHAGERHDQAPEADAAVTTEPGVACVVQVADCLPVLFASADGRAVGAAHAGWRGLAAGVLEHTLHALCQAAGTPPEQVVCWLGPCIGPGQFEVGAEVLQAFGEPATGSPLFSPRQGADGRPRWLADLPGLARRRLQRAGVRQVTGGRWCTVSAPSRFYSYRRDRITGRQAAAVWIGR